MLGISALLPVAELGTHSQHPPTPPLSRQPRHDIPGALGLGGEGAAAETPRRPDHQCQVQGAGLLGMAGGQPGSQGAATGASPDPSHSVNGDVRFFDPRMPESVNVLQIVKGLTALDIHPQANLIAW